MIMATEYFNTTFLAEKNIGKEHFKYESILSYEITFKMQCDKFCKMMRKNYNNSQYKFTRCKTYIWNKRK